VILLSIDAVAGLMRIHFNWPGRLARLLDLVEPFHLVNRYGLFAIMTTWRLEIIVEGSIDGRQWEPYEFKWKPGEVRRPPPWMAPHQPRLDWQMWFAALGSRASNAWFDSFCDRLTEGTPEVLALLWKNPFPVTPPRYIRGVIYHYRFTDRQERRASGAWWHRERRALYGS
jgi:hypothetical protein